MLIVESFKSYFPYSKPGLRAT